MTIEPPFPASDPRLRYEEEVHLVAGILDRADRTVRPSSILLLTWGILGAAVDLGYYLYYHSYYSGGHPSEILLHFPVPALLLGLCMTVARAALVRRERRTFVDRAVAITFGVAAVCAIVPGFLGFPRWVMAGPDYGILWNLLAASAAASIGLQYRARPLVAGAAALGLSILAARFELYDIDLVLAIGMFIGLAGPGAYYALRNARR